MRSTAFPCCVFLLLAALYESWSIPLWVMLVIPLGIVGAIIAATMRGLYNDIYFQVGFVRRWACRRRTPS